MFEVKKVDIKEIITLVKEADNGENFLPSISDGTFSVEKFFNENNKNISLYGSFIEDKLVGFLSIISDEEFFVSIGPMYISKKFRGKKFGEKQIEEIINILKQNNIKGIKTKTWGENKASRKIFEN